MLIPLFTEMQGSAHTIAHRDAGSAHAIAHRATVQWVLSSTKAVELLGTALAFAWEEGVVSRDFHDL